MSIVRVLSAVLTALILSVVAAGCTTSAPVAEIVVQPAAHGSLDEGLPLTAKFTDRMGMAQVARLDAPLEDIDGVVIAEFRAGDVGYMPDEQSIVVFLTDGGGIAGDGVILLGRVSAGLTQLESCVRECMAILRTDDAAGN